MLKKEEYGSLQTMIVRHEIVGVGGAEEVVLDREPHLLGEAVGDIQERRAGAFVGDTRDGGKRVDVAWRRAVRSQP